LPSIVIQRSFAAGRPIDPSPRRRYHPAMNLVRHVLKCNAYSYERFLPLVHEGVTLGLVRRDNATILRQFPDIFRVEDEGVTVLAGGGFERVSAAVDGAVERLVAGGIIPKWRNEFFAVAPRWGAPPHFRLDRGAVPFFGTRAYGVHLNGWRRDGGTLALWIGRRAPDKKVAPNRLDNLVAGGISWEHGLEATLIKEAAEEAAIPRDLIARAVPTGAISYRMETELGVRHDVLFVYDLETPPEFVPRNTDGELTEFMLMPAGAVIDQVRAGDAFKFNVNLVLIDFALRHGIVTPAEPDYLELVTGLRRALD
jgi:8-oxo-dGTP pyrophosphatase MutT (NUDIX family)